MFLYIGKYLQHFTVSIAIVILIALTSATGRAAAAEKVYTLYYDGLAHISTLQDYFDYFYKESGGTVSITLKNKPCPDQPPADAICVDFLSDTGNWTDRWLQGHAATRKRFGEDFWTLIMSDRAFIGHEIGHALGMIDLYDPAQAGASSQYLMDFVDGRRNPASLFQLRRAGWAQTNVYDAGTFGTTIFILDQFQFCQKSSCFTMGLHYRPVTEDSSLPLFFESEFEDWSASLRSEVPRLQRLQSRELGLEGARGRWNIPPGLGVQHVDWQYIPQPLPHVRITFEGFDVMDAQTNIESQPVAPGWQAAAIGSAMIVLLLVLLAPRKKQKSEN